MPDMICDGTGQGFLAQVDEENHLHTSSNTMPMIAYKSGVDGSAFGISTPMLTITDTGGRVLWIQNTDGAKDFYCTDFWFNWNGGTANFNRPMTGQMIFGDTQPTTNTTVSGAGVLNRKTSGSANMTVLYWDETGHFQHF